MSWKLLSCLFLLTLAAMACEGDSRNQVYSGLSSPNPFSIPIGIPSADRITREVEEFKDDGNDDAEDRILGTMMDFSLCNLCPGNGDPNVLRPVIVSLRRELLQLVKSRNENKKIESRSLSVLRELFAWRKNQASIFYNLISKFPS